MPRMTAEEKAAWRASQEAKLEERRLARAAEREEQGGLRNRLPSDEVFFGADAERFNAKSYGGRADWTWEWAAALSRARGAFNHSAPLPRVAGKKDPELDEAWRRYDEAYRKLWPLPGGPIDFEDLRRFRP